MGFRIAKWVRTPFLISHKVLQIKVGFANFLQGVQIFSHPLRNEILDFSQALRNALFSDLSIIQKIFKAFPHLS